jgi:hypothetical protein
MCIAAPPADKTPPEDCVLLLKKLLRHARADGCWNKSRKQFREEATSSLLQLLLQLPLELQLLPTTDQLAR